MTPRHTARAIILHEDQLMLMERWRAGKHYFSIPGGGIEPDETPEVTVVREVMEETSCVVTITRELYQLTLDDGSRHAIFLCAYVSGVPVLPPDAPEAQQMSNDNKFQPGWVSLQELSELHFLVWKPVAERLQRDLIQGFSADIVSLQGNVVR